MASDRGEFFPWNYMTWPFLVSDIRKKVYEASLFGRQDSKSLLKIWIQVSILEHNFFQKQILIQGVLVISGFEGNENPWIVKLQITRTLVFGSRCPIEFY